MNDDLKEITTEKNNLYDDKNIDNDAEIASSNEDSTSTSFNIDSSSSEEKKTVTTENSIENIASPIKTKRWPIIMIISIIVLLLVLFLSTIFALVNINNKTIISGVSIKGIDVSNLTKEQATKKISSIFNEKLSSAITLKYGEQQIEIFPEQLSISFDIDSSVDLAYSIGRKSNIFKNNFDILSSLFYKTNISPSFTYNEDSINTYLTEFENTLPNKLIEPSYYIDGQNLVITSGKDGVLIDRDRLKFEIIYCINNLKPETNNVIDVCIIHKGADAIDIDAIHSEIYKEAKDAYYTQNPFCVYPHTEGVDFEISVDEAKAMLQESKESYIIPLKFVTPSVTTNDIGTEAFPDLLATYSTTYSTKNVNRSTNIRLASSKIDGTVLMPGETFSYNTTVGKRTAAAGFKSAAVYSGGQVTNGIGGGICQVSSTLYNSVLLANLEIVERTNHGFNPGYVPAGRDATVSWGGPDFKFKNNRNYPVKIICSGTGGTIVTKIFGLKEENEYDVEISSYITSYIQYRTITQNDNSLPSGTTKVLQSGSNGCRSVCYRILKQNGEVISKTLLSSDTYSPHNKVVAVGTKAD